MARTFGRIILAVILTSNCICTVAQMAGSFVSAYSAGTLASDRFSHKQDVFMLQPAILPVIGSTHISGHVQSRFSGFGVYAMGMHVATSLPHQFGAGLSILGLGHPDYKTSGITASLGKKLTQNLSIGVSQRLQKTKIATEGRPWTGSSSLGALYLQNKWGLGLYLGGLMQWNKSYDPEYFSIHTSAYIKWTDQTQMFFALEYADKFTRPVMGIRQVLIHDVAVFGAFQWYPSRYGLGFLIPLNEQIVSILSSQFHPELGWSPSIGMQWKGKRNKVKGVR